MGEVDLVLFDIDGTLLNSGGCGRAAMAAAAADLFGRPGLFDDLSFAGAVDSGIVAKPGTWRVSTTPCGTTR